MHKLGPVAKWIMIRDSLIESWKSPTKLANKKPKKKVTKKKREAK